MILKQLPKQLPALHLKEFLQASMGDRAQLRRRQLLDHRPEHTPGAIEHPSLSL